MLRRRRVSRYVDGYSHLSRTIPLKNLIEKNRAEEAEVEPPAKRLLTLPRL